ncbi:MAG: DUF1489 domain-containing protein [Boseongicola sp.]|nr:DUF1489 domain-containing protein [Boseongicola sp.]
MREPLHLIKLSVGSESVTSLAKWQATRAAQARDGLPRHVTRMWPRRKAELLDGGSIYWVIRGFVRVRQRIVRLDEADLGDGIRRCAIVLDPALVLTAATRRRPFQGWRYLRAEDAPIDLTHDGTDDDLSPQLLAALAEIGVR